MHAELAHIPLARLADAYGIDDVSDAYPLRVGTNVVVALPAAGKVMRIRTASVMAVHSNLLDVADLARRADVLGPASEMLSIVGEYVVTLWPLGYDLPTVEEGYAGFGAALRSLHQLSPRDGLGRLNTLWRLDARLPELAELGVPADDVDFLRRRADELRGVHDAMRFSGSDLIHADAHIGNAVIADGAVKLIDLDGLRVGPWQYDLVPTAVAARRCGEVAIFEQVVAGYGRDPRGWEFFNDACALRELTSVSWLGTMYAYSETHRDEFHRQLDSLRDGTDHRWRAL